MKTIDFILDGLICTPQKEGFGTASKVALKKKGAHFWPLPFFSAFHSRKMKGTTCFRSFSIGNELFTTLFTSQLGRGKIKLCTFKHRKRYGSKKNRKKM